MKFLLILVAAVMVLFVLRFLVIRRRRLAQRSLESAPPGTIGLDEVDAVRPEIDASALASVRSAVGSDVPDSVLADALLDATPTQLRQMFAAVPSAVMADVMGTDTRGSDDVQRRPIREEELAQLRAMSESVDDLEIWGFAESH